MWVKCTTLYSFTELPSYWFEEFASYLSAKPIMSTYDTQYKSKVYIIPERKTFCSRQKSSFKLLWHLRETQEQKNIGSLLNSSLSSPVFSISSKAISRHFFLFVTPVLSWLLSPTKWGNLWFWNQPVVLKFSVDLMNLLPFLSTHNIIITAVIHRKHSYKIPWGGGDFK